MKEAILFIGLPGSGKTTYIEKNYKSGYIKVSADDFKDARPDLKPTSENEGEYAEQLETYHQWSVNAAETLMKVISDFGANLCMDSGGVNNSYSLRIIQMLKDKGYRIKLIHMDTPIEVCLGRNKKRTEGRLPEIIILEKAKKIGSCVDKQKLAVDEYVRITYDQLQLEFKIGDRVKLLTEGWDGWGFERSLVQKIHRSLISIKGDLGKGHEMTVRRNEIELIK